jgi:hypothetical protein
MTDKPNRGGSGGSGFVMTDQKPNYTPFKPGSFEMTISLHFGALCKPISEQLIAQGFNLSEKEALRFQNIALSITMLKLHGIIPDSVVRTSEQKLMKMICRAESLAECEP